MRKVVWLDSTAAVVLSAKTEKLRSGSTYMSVGVQMLTSHPSGCIISDELSGYSSKSDKARLLKQLQALQAGLQEMIGAVGAYKIEEIKEEKEGKIKVSKNVLAALRKAEKKIAKKKK